MRHSLPTLILDMPFAFCVSADAALFIDDQRVQIRAAASPALTMNYDPGNVAWQTGKDPSAEIAEIAPIVRHLHLKDAAAGSSPAEPRWVLPGDGVVDVETIFRGLQQQNYVGEIVLEPHMPGIDIATLSNFKDRVVKLWACAQEPPRNLQRTESDLPDGNCFHTVPIL